MSVETSLGDAPSPPSIYAPIVPADPAASAAPAAPVAPETPAAPAPELLQLSETFGGDFTGFSSVEDAQRAAVLIAQSYAQAGTIAPVQRVAQQAQVIKPVVVEAEEDYGDLDPKVVARLKRQDADLKQMKVQAQQFQDRITHDQSMVQQQQNQDLLNRAISAVDALADPRYGVGGNRTFTQDMARENLLRVALKIGTGIEGAGRTPPTIEKLISIAVLAESGKLPAVKPAAGSKGAPPAPVAGGNNTQGVPQVPRRKTGGEVDTYTGDKEFMDGARAIVSRVRR